MVLTFAQALQLVGLAPCLFIIMFLLSLSVRNPQTIVSIFYFISLASGFALPLLDLFPALSHNLWVKGGLLLSESMLTAFSFLLIYQFMTGRVPPPGYWLVLAIPVLGGSSLIYASMLQLSDTCLVEQVCPDITSIKTLYNIISSAFIFLLLIYYSSRSGGVAGDDVTKKHKYWLIIALILLHLMVLALDLTSLSGNIDHDQAQLGATIFRLTFIYLVLTSLLRVFYPTLGNQAVFSHEAPYDPEVDRPHVERIMVLLEVEKAYRGMRLNRAGLAKLVGISEHHLSRVINSHFSKNFSELINGYRIEEAKKRLAAENTQITVIGFEVGFNSIASFNRVFKNKVGVSPTEFRNKSAAESGLVAS